VVERGTSRHTWIDWLLKITVEDGALKPGPACSAIDWHKSLDLLAIAAGDCVLIYDLTLGQYLEPIKSEQFKSGIRSLCWCFERNSLLVCTAAGTVYVSTAQTSVSLPITDSSDVLSVCPSPQGRVFAARSGQGLLVCDVLLGHCQPLALPSGVWGVLTLLQSVFKTDSVVVGAGLLRWSPSGLHLLSVDKAGTAVVVVETFNWTSISTAPPAPPAAPAPQLSPLSPSLSAHSSSRPACIGTLNWLGDGAFVVSTVQSMSLFLCRVFPTPSALSAPAVQMGGSPFVIDPLALQLPRGATIRDVETDDRLLAVSFQTDESTEGTQGSPTALPMVVVFMVSLTPYLSLTPIRTCIYSGAEAGEAPTPESFSFRSAASRGVGAGALAVRWSNHSFAVYEL